MAKKSSQLWKDRQSGENKSTGDREGDREFPRLYELECV